MGIWLQYQFFILIKYPLSREMNKKCYRIIFCHAKNMFIVVAENAKTRIKNVGQRPVSRKAKSKAVPFEELWSIKALVAAMSCFMAFSPVYANIQVDHQVGQNQQAVIGLGQNQQKENIPVVNIQTAKNGISHNVYSQFDVNQSGVVLNNSRNGAASVLVGHVSANPFLNTGEARLILNEVNSRNPSKLHGNIEVAGQHADVVIANPSGIEIQGGGFINVNRATLTTGSPQFNVDGTLKQFMVNQGKITVNGTPDGSGLGGNDNNAEYVDIYSRALEVNAKVHANQSIQVVAGTHTVSEDLSSIVPIQTQDTAATIAIDIKQLGGMYANNIYLIGNEKGLGVSNAGTLAAANNLIITSTGKVTHSGTISSLNKQGGGVSIRTDGDQADIEIRGNIQSYDTTNIDSGNNLNLSSGNITVNANPKIKNSSALVIGAKGKLDVASGTKIQNLSQTGDVYGYAKDIALAQDADIQSKNGVVSLHADENFTAMKDVKLLAGQDLNLRSNNNLTLSGGALQATNGSINIQNLKKQNNTLSLEDTRLEVGKNINISSANDVSLKNLNLNVKNSSEKGSEVNVQSGANLVWHNQDQPFSNVFGQIQFIAANTLTVQGAGAGSILKANDGLHFYAKEISTKDIELGGTGTSEVNIISEGGDIHLDQGTKLVADQGNINVNALTGNIAAQSLTASSLGAISVIANKNVDLIAMSSETAVEGATSKNIHYAPSMITAEKGINIASINSGDVGLDTIHLDAKNGDIQLQAKQSIHLKRRADVNQLKNDDGTYTAKDTDLWSELKGQNIHITSGMQSNLSKSKVKATKDIILEARGLQLLEDLSLESAQNIILHSDSIQKIWSLNSHSSGHTAISSKAGLYINADDMHGNWMPSESVDLRADGVLSLVSGGEQLQQDLNLNAGAILIKSGTYLNAHGSVEASAVGSTLLAKNSELKKLNGHLSIQAKENLTLEVPYKQTFSALEDMDLISEAGGLFLQGENGFAGNDPKRVAHLTTEKGAIHLQGTKVNLQGTQLTASKDISVISTKNDLTIDGVKNSFTNLNFKEKAEAEKPRQADLIKEMDTFRASQEYLNYQEKLKKANELINIGKEYMSSAHGYMALGWKQMKDDGEKDLANIKETNKELIAKEDQLQTQIDQENAAVTFFESLSSGQQHSAAVIASNLGNINLISAQGLSIGGSSIDAKKGRVNLEAAGTLAEQEHQIQGQYKNDQPNSVKQGKIKSSIIIDATQDSYELGQTTDDNYNWRSPVNITTINAEQGVKIKSTGTAVTDNLVLQGVGITSEHGDVDIEAHKNIIFDVAVENNYDKSKSIETKRKWYGSKKTITTLSKADRSNGSAVRIDANNINIKSQEKNTPEMQGQDRTSIDMYSSQLAAHGGKINIQAGGDLNFLTADDVSLQTTDISKKSSFIGIKYNKSNTTNTRNINTELPATLKADYIGTKSGFDTRLKGTVFDYLDGASIEAGGTILLEAASNTIAETLKKRSNSVAWQVMQDKGAVTQTAQLPSFNGPVAPVFKAKGGLMVQIPIGEKDNNKKELREEIIKLANQPGNQYLKDLINRDDVDWQKIVLAQKDWNYKQQGLTGAGAAIIAIIIAICTYGAGSAAAGAIGASSTGATSAMAQAAITTLSTQTSISLINNGGDIGQTLKDLGSKESVKSLAASVVTAGLMSQLSTAFNITLTNEVANKAVNNFVQEFSSTLISTSVQGGSLSENLKAALLAGVSSTAQGQLAMQIKGLENKDYLLHKLAHAAAGCAVGALQKSCEAGAIGAVVGEIVASSIATPDDFKTFDELTAHQKKVRDLSKLAAGVVAAYSGYDVNVAANSAETAIRNNRQLHEEEIKRIDILAKGDSSKKDRLTIAACALIKCSAGLDPETLEYKFLSQIETLGKTQAYEAERKLLSQQKFNYDYAVLGMNTQWHGTDQLFQYSAVDSSLDVADRLDAKYSLVERGSGALTLVGGAVGVAASGATATTCVTGFGCVAAGMGLLTSADYVHIGLDKVITGKSQNTLGAMAISQVTGMPLETAESLYSALNLAGTTLRVQAGIKAGLGTSLFSAKSCGGIACFTAGTLIETSLGLKAIEQFKGGELIWSRDELSLEYGYRPVIATKVTDQQPIFHVIVQDQSGQTETLETTAEHPFWLKDFGWIKASLLRSGMTLLDRNNQELTVRQQLLIPHTLHTVYNIEVDGFHTYHVGELGVWVHNANCCDVTRAQLEKAYSKMEDKYFGPNGEVYAINPFTNQKVQINKTVTIQGKTYAINPLTEKLEDATKIQVSVDHILPQSAFEKIANFDKLPKKTQEKLMNDPENLQPIWAKGNSSKGGRVETETTGWLHWASKPISLDYRKALQEIQDRMRDNVKHELAKLNIERR